MISGDEKRISAMREGGRILSDVLAAVKKQTAAGVIPTDLDALAESLIRARGAEPAFKGYRAPGSRKLFPATLCVSLNEAIVHGIPGSRPIRADDVVKLDLGLRYNGYYLDAATTVYLGSHEAVRQMLAAVRKALEKAAGVAKSGNTIGDVGAVINRVISQAGFVAVKNLCGHGIGTKLHDKPDVLNFGKPATGARLTRGMTIAIEPMGSFGSEFAVLGRDGSFLTDDGSLAAHFEATVAVDDARGEILTPLV